MFRRSTKLRRFFSAIALAGAASLSLSACADDSLAEQYRSGDNKNYIAGDGTVTEFQNVDARKASAAWTSVTESGGILSSSDLTASGNVTVVNFWYAGCAPCRAEAAELQQLNDEFSADGVQFLGVNVRDTAPTILAFARNFGWTFPSVVDAQSGDVMLAYTGIVTPQAVPTTLVLDGDGRVSARILGRFEVGILRTLIKTAMAEGNN
jgi:thiol-disulfide isomerase/thioredoxin